MKKRVYSPFEDINGESLYHRCRVGLCNNLGIVPLDWSVTEDKEDGGGFYFVFDKHWRRWGLTDFSVFVDFRQLIESGYEFEIVS